MAPTTTRGEGCQSSTHHGNRGDSHHGNRGAKKTKGEDYLPITNCSLRSQFAMDVNRCCFEAAITYANQPVGDQQTARTERWASA
jgi:hypothetical protein